MENNQKSFQERLEDFRNRKSVRQKLKEETQKKVTEDDFAFELANYWFLYVMAAVSALFTITLGVFMGLNPQVQPDKSVFFNTDFPHVMLAGTYAIAFVAVTEGAFIIAKRLFYTREKDNRIQSLTMLAMMIISGVSILGTGIAGGVVIASIIDFMSAFNEVPAWAQTWVIRIIPALLVVYIFLLTAYALGSNKAEVRRKLKSDMEDSKLEIQQMISEAEQMAELEIKSKAVELFLQKMDAGGVDLAEVFAAAKSGDLASMIATESNRKPAQSAQQDPHATPYRYPVRAKTPMPNYTQVRKFSQCLTCGNAVNPGYSYCSETCYSQSDEYKRKQQPQQPIFTQPTLIPVDDKLRADLETISANFHQDGVTLPDEAFLTDQAREVVPVTLPLRKNGNGNGKH
jgi:predicted nucleic acid-binding Zn ribbon protein